MADKAHTTIMSPDPTLPSASNDTHQAASSNGWNVNNPSIIFGRVLAIVVSAMLGTNFALTKLINEHMPYALAGALRFGFAAVAITSAVLALGLKKNVTGGRSSELSGEIWAAMLAGTEIGGWNTLGYYCQAIGMLTAQASKAAFYYSMAVIVVTVLDFIFLNKQLKMKGAAAVIIAIAGVGVLQLGPAYLAGTDLAPTVGDILLLGQANFYGIAYWRLARILSRFPNHAGPITAGQLQAFALGSIVFCILSGDVPSRQQLQAWFSDPSIVLALLWTGFVSTAGAYYLETVSLKAIEASELATLQTSVPLWGAFFAMLILGEKLAPIGWAGGLLIVAGCLLDVMPEIERKAKDTSRDETKSLA